MCEDDCYLDKRPGMRRIESLERPTINLNISIDFKNKRRMGFKRASSQQRDQLQLQ